MAASVAPPKPRLRGVLHLFGFFVAIAIGVPLVLSAEPGRARLSAVVFAVCVATCFGASALYHTPNWRPGIRSWFGRLDHAGVYLLIAGTYTPFGLLVLSVGWAIPILSIVRAASFAAILLKIFWYETPKWLSAAIGISIGWVALVASSQLLKLDVTPIALVVAGGFFYTTGAIIYAKKWPNPYPAVFGYHELFHAFTLIAVSLQYAAIAFYVLPRG
jgi:hemolysin III